MIDISKVTVDEELKSLLCPLQDVERENLVSSVVKNGFTDPVIVWLGHGVLVDGHNRYDIWQKELKSDPDKAPEIREMRFENDTEVREWMLRRQLGRRNLTPGERSEIALKLEPVLKEKAKENQKAAGGDKSQKALLTNSSKALGSTKAEGKQEKVNVRKEVAKAAGVSEDTLRKAKKVFEKAPEELKKEIREGTKSINAAHKQVVKSEEPKRDKRTSFDPTTFDPAMMPEGTSDKVTEACNKIINEFDTRLKWLYDHRGELVRAIDAVNDAKPFFNHKALIAHYGKLFDEVEVAHTTQIQLSKCWKFRSK